MLIFSLTYGSLVNQVLCSLSGKSVQSIYLFFLYIFVQLIHHFVDGKQCSEVFLYPGVLKAISRTTPQNMGLCCL